MTIPSSEASCARCEIVGGCVEFDLLRRVNEADVPYPSELRSAALDAMLACGYFAREVAIVEALTQTEVSDKR